VGDLEDALAGLKAERPKDEGKPSLEDLLRSLETPASQKEQPKPGPKPQAAQHEGDPGSALLVAVNAITMGVCRARCIQLKIKWTRELARICTLTPEEKDALKPFSAMAASYILELLRYAPMIATGVFLFVYWSFLQEKFALIKEAGSVQKKEVKGKAGAKEPEAAEPKATRAGRKKKKRPGDDAKLISAVVKRPEAEAS
jgi:hypothetical protein